MDKIAECCTTHLIQGDGTFNEEGLDNFLKQVKLVERSYVVVAVMGPQSSGKSTLLNHLFHTNFVQMNAENGRSQTTQGIWIARCTGIEPCTIVMDVEGTDGQERGEDKAFEKKTSLFAIAVSDIVIINMWCHDIGRQDAGNKPLLKTVFGVMLRLFSPRKRTLLFVIRDKTKTPLERLDIDLRNDIQEIWDSVPKPKALEATDLSNFFNVEVVALSNYEEKKEQFKEQVACLRQKFYHSIAPGGLACDRQGVIPASGFSFSTKRIWEEIKENKDLNLPNHAVMVATVRCEEIVCKKFESFVTNEDWLQLEEDVKSHLVPGFGKRLSSLVENCLSGYDEEVIHYDGNVGSTKREQLNEKLMHLVQLAYTRMFEHIQSETLVNFKTAFNNALNEGRGFAMAAHNCTKTAMRLFDELSNDATINQANWDTTKIRDKLSHKMHSHISEVQTAKLHELTKLHESNISEAICSPVQALLEEGTANTWPAIRRHLHRETETAVSSFYLALSAFEMDEKEMKVITSELKSCARRLVKGKAEDVAGKVLLLMIDRFAYIFNHDDDSLPRGSWTGNEDIQEIVKTTRTSCLMLLSVMAAIRLDEDVTDSIWHTLFHRLVEASPNTHTGGDPLASTTWEKVTAANTLIPPFKCLSLWKEFQTQTEFFINQAIASKEANTRSNSDNHTESSGVDHSSYGLDPVSHHIGMAIGHGIGAIIYPFRTGVVSLKQGVELVGAIISQL